jgi:tRNA A37 threonylcarbamoyladenosine dehydratase
MTRTGVGNFHIADFDTYEPANINRQFGTRVPDFGRPKMQVMEEIRRGGFTAHLLRVAC